MPKDHRLKEKIPGIDLDNLEHKAQHGDRLYLRFKNGQEEVWVKGYKGKWRKMWPGDDSYKPRSKHS